MAEVSPARRAYLAEHPYCACCDKPSVCVHEIANGPNREKALGKRIAWLATCWDCNSNRLTNKGGEWPVARQLAAKVFQDPSYYKLEEYLDLVGLGPKAIEHYEVVRYGRTITVKWVGPLA